MISFANTNDTLRSIFGTEPISGSIMTMLMWKFIKNANLPCRKRGVVTERSFENQHPDIVEVFGNGWITSGDASVKLWNFVWRKGLQAKVEEPVITKDMLTPQKAEDITGVSASHLRKLCKSNSIPHVVKGTRYYIKYSDIKTLVDNEQKGKTQ